MDKRLAEMAFAPMDELVAWLSKILVNGEVSVEDGDVILFRNHDLNYGGGFCYWSDPVTKGVMIASAIAGGGLWPFAFPNLLKEIDLKWKAQKGGKRA